MYGFHRVQAVFHLRREVSFKGCYDSVNSLIRIGQTGGYCQDLAPFGGDKLKKRLRTLPHLAPARYIGVRWHCPLYLYLGGS